MLVFIAPFSAVDRESNRDLGAARKLEFFLSLATQLAHDVVLINTAHEKEGWSHREVRDARVGDRNIREITLRRYPVRTIGKMLNLFEVAAVSRELAKLGKPDTVWIYNPYAFESLLARALTRQSGARLVLQFEDWLFSRRRWHPKPMLDFITWRFLLPAPSLCLAVNEYLSARELQRSSCPVVLCPGVVSDGLIEVCRRRRPFSREGTRTVIGYFGGLSAEKGSDVVLDMIRLSGERFAFHVCGSGPLAAEFERLRAEGHPVRFHGRVDDETLLTLIADCDVLVNPHASIEKMSNGVFPFKVVEYVASGRLVISTDLPAISMKEIHDAICFAKPEAEAIVEALANAEEIYLRKLSKIEKAIDAVSALLTQGAFRHTLSPILAKRGTQ
ncbi:putative glycosyl transferase [Caballeronia pedi]|uniref:Glycosyl transferase n=1 Tax=Caballeronia pedi TaxID=1777141 RepID=A0A158CG38_9BURK|nr:glycosyltransferase family 4 protein [Caballeronia pedi]SAK81279.1 putative glycosyl transferase [Caballeronia pedi]